MTDSSDSDIERDSDRAKQKYLSEQNAEEQAKDWATAIQEAECAIQQLLEASNNLANVESALLESGAHSLVLRHLTAPPLSQDQFKLKCPGWSKGGEKSGRPASQEAAEEVSKVFDEWRDRALTPWLNTSRKASKREVEKLTRSCAPLLASQSVNTARRNRLAARQEMAVINILDQLGWTKMHSKLIDQRADIPPKHFMHKTRFATNTAAPQEVDIACGLSGSYVAAMECKVTNDETNSVKRINDVIKKATAWREHWGSFVTTVAVLEGVIAAKDVQRLVDGGVVVFWSHDLDPLFNWLKERL